jgi:hypothetical protein
MQIGLLETFRHTHRRTCTEASCWVQINMALLLSRDMVMLRVNVADCKWARQFNALKTKTL